MKLMYKINLVAVLVMVGVGLSVTIAALSTITKVTYKLNREVMSREVDNIVSIFHNSVEDLKKNKLAKIDSYNQQAQNEILTELEDYRFRDTGNLIIVTSEGKVIKHATRAPGEASGIKKVPKMMTYKSGATEFQYNGELHFFRFKYFPHWDWLVILSISSKEMLQPRSQFLTKASMILLVCLVLGALIFVWYINRIVAPIRQLANATAFVSEGKWHTPLPQPKGSDEVGQLTAAFRKMAQRLEETYNNLQSNLYQIEKSQDDLQESEEKYRDLVELLPLVVFEINPQGDFVFANQFATETFGYQKNEWSQNLNICKLVIEKEQEIFKDNLSYIMNGQSTGMMEYTGLRKDGSTFPCMAMASSVALSEERSGIRGIFIDITERKTLEIKLRQAQKYLETILNNVADPIFVKDEDHCFLQINEAYSQFFGHSRNEIINKTEHDFLPPQEAEIFIEEEKQVFASQQARETEMTITGRNGKQKIILTKKAAFKDTNDNNLLVGIIKDITKRKKMEQELFKSDKLKSVGVLAGGIAHDFNNILTAVIGNLSLAKNLTEKESKIHHHILASEKACIRAKDLTQQLLTFSKGGAPVKQIISLVDLIEELATFTLRGSKVHCEVDFPDNLWTVVVDEGQISRVVQNIIVNASQAMVDGGTVYISASNKQMELHHQLPLKKGPYVRLIIKDTGTGITPDLLPNIFDPYFTTKKDGSGLGLATAFSILQRHDGHIEVETQPGKGTSFILYLPASSEKVFQKNIETTVLHQGNGTILVMDDEKIVRDVIGDMLAVLGYSYTFAEHGVEALEKYELASKSGKPFDLVIMDLTISGGMGGQEAISHLLKIDPDVKAVVASGYSQDPIMANFDRHGFKGVITKPFELEKLSILLHQQLASHNAI